MTQIAWPKLIQAGLHGLGLRPAEFWALTPAELMIMLGMGRQETPMTRSGLERLIAAFPDDDKGDPDGQS